MKNSALITIIASMAVARAQVTVDNGTYTCAKPGGAYCAGDSLKTDIIIRCDAKGQGQPGRCSDNLAGEPPVGVKPALCFQTSETSGDAACEKNCIVYADSGSSTLPADQCTPTESFSTSSSGSATTTTSCDCTGSETTTMVVTSGTTVCPGSSTSTPGVPTTTGPVYPSSNGTGITGTAPPVTTRTTVTPSGPTTSLPSTLSTAGAAVHAAGGVLAGLGMALAYIL